MYRYTPTKVSIIFKFTKVSMTDVNWLDFSQYYDFESTVINMTGLK